MQKTFKIAKVCNEEELKEYQKQIKHFNGNGLGSSSGSFNCWSLADGAWITSLTVRKRPYGAWSSSNKPCTSLSEFQEVKNTKTTFWEYAGSIQLDVNGVKGPNIVGRDIFNFELGNNGMLYPIGGADYAMEKSNCKTYKSLSSCTYYWKNTSGGYGCTPSSYGLGCAGRIMEEGWKMTY